MLTASAAPSPGSVPAPNSSNKTNDLSVILSRISMIVLMCPEKVDKLCSMLCSSPISQYTPSKIARSADFAGTYIPVIASKTNNPTSFNVTVFPPVLGPVMRSILSSPFIESETGTTFLPSMRGCLPAFMRTTPLVLTLGLLAFHSLPRSAFAKMTSISVMVSYAIRSLSSQPCMDIEKLRKILSISTCSSTFAVRRSLLSSTIAIGSTYKVDPDADWSWMSP